MKATVTNAAGNVTSYDYDTTNGRLLWEKNALNQYTRYAYNALGQVTNIWGDTQYPVEFGYDQFGQKTTMRTFRTDAAWNGTAWPGGVAGDLTTWTFDEASGVVTAKTDAANQSVTYTYTTDGKLNKRIWARGIVTNYLYDTATGELLKVDYEDDTPDITYTYNRQGQLATVQDAAGIRNFVYNANFDLIKETINGIYSRELNRTYTDTGMKGRSLSLRIGDVLNYSYGYDEYGRLNKITTPMGDFNYTHLENSDLIAQMTRPNSITTTWSYEPHRNLITQVSNGNISILGYTNNAIGNRISMSRNGTSFTTPDIITYTYNNRNEVIGAISNQDTTYNYSYNYNAIGNRTVSDQNGSILSYTSNTLNQYTMINTEHPTYDSDGNMVQRKSWTQLWNGENRMIETYNINTKLTFKYDYLGRRIEKNVFKKEGENWIQTQGLRYVYDNYTQIEEIDALKENVVVYRYSWQPSVLIINFPLSITDVANNANYAYHSDGNKNIIELADKNGHIIAHYEYSPFGNQTITSGDFMSNNPFRFSSEIFDSETSLIYYNYRYYDTNTGCWNSRDPINEKGGINLYLFVHNNTINYYDINGLGIMDDIANAIYDWARSIAGEEECAKCNGIPYDKTVSCCVDDNIYSKGTQIDTGISVGATPIEGWGGLVFDHNWIEGDNGLYGSWDRGAENEDVGTLDKLFKPFPGALDFSSPGFPSSPGRYSGKMRPVKLAPCNYDIDKFRVFTGICG